MNQYSPDPVQNDTTTSCGICGSNADHQQYKVREMMFGTREWFPYFQCKDCGCLQLAEIPADISKYYPDNYYSFSTGAFLQGGGFYRWLHAKWVRYLITHHSMIGWILAKLKNKKLPVFEVFRAAGINTSHKILDIGSGSGKTIYLMKDAGFQVTGSDEFIAEDILHDNGLRVLKANLFDIREENWDVIMFNHSFEHLPQQEEHLRQTYRLLKPGGICVIRIPTVSSDAWEKYRQDWVHLDAPRHFFIHSHQSISLIAGRTGFRVREIVQDSTEFQFAGSEQYQHDIPLFGDPRSYIEGSRVLFSDAQLKDFASRAEQLNRNNRGDSIGVILVKD